VIYNVMGVAPLFHREVFTSMVLANVVLFIKLKERSIYQHTGLERSLFVGKLGFCIPPTIFFSFAPGKEAQWNPVNTATNWPPEIFRNNEGGPNAEVTFENY